MNVKICVSGKIASGKTTISHALRKYFNFRVISFGDIMREYLKKSGIKVTRDALHKKSEEIVATIGNYGAMNWFIENSPQVNWDENLIVEGCRHPETYERLRELFSPSFLLHCSCCESIQIKRLQRRDGLSIKEIMEIIAHPVEEDLDINKFKC